MPTLPTEPRPKTVLIIEDGQSLRWVACEILRDAGYYVIEAATAEQGLHVAPHVESLDLLLCDVLLPGANGSQAARELSKARPGLPVLFMSGFADDAHVRRIVACGQAGFLPKPFTPAQLLQKVQEMLDPSEAGISSPTSSKLLVDSGPPTDALGTVQRILEPGSETPASGTQAQALGWCTSDGAILTALMQAD